MLYSSGNYITIDAYEHVCVNKILSVDSTLLILTYPGTLYSCDIEESIKKLYENFQQKITCIDAWRGTKGGIEGVVAGTIKGTLIFLNAAGEIQKQVEEVHQGSINLVKLSRDYQTVAVAGDDSRCKLYSRNGMLRTEFLVNEEGPVLSAAWSVDSTVLVLGCSQELFFRSLVGHKLKRIKLASGNVSFIDASIERDLVLAGTETGSAGLYDFMGTTIYEIAQPTSSFIGGRLLDYNFFALLCSFDELLLIDNRGNFLSRVSYPHITCLAVDKRGYQIWLGTLNGCLLKTVVLPFSKCYYDNYIVELKSPCLLSVGDLNSAYTECLETGAAISNVEMKYGYILVISGSKIFLASLHAIAAPITLDIAPQSLILAQLGATGPVIFTKSATIVATVYDWGFAPLGTIRIPVTDISSSLWSANSSWVAWVDVKSPRVSCLSSYTQHNVLRYSHILPLLSVSISALFNPPLLLLLDSSADLYLLLTHDQPAKKVAAFVTSFEWHHTLPSFAFCTTSEVTVVMAPKTLFMDERLFKLSSLTYSSPTGSSIRSFSLSTIYLLRPPQVETLICVDSLMTSLLKAFSQADRSLEWKCTQGLRFARLVNSAGLWALLAAFCLEHREVVTAEAALAALGLLDRVQYLTNATSFQQTEVQQAHLLTLFGKSEEAAEILLSKRQLRPLIELYLRQFEFKKALETARRASPPYEWFVDWVLHERLRFLQETNMKQEFDAYFVKSTPARAWEDVESLLNSI